MIAVSRIAPHPVAPVAADGGRLPLVRRHGRWSRCGGRRTRASACCSRAVGFASLLSVAARRERRRCRTRSACSRRTSSSRCSCTRCSRSRAAGSRSRERAAARRRRVPRRARRSRRSPSLFDPLTRYHSDHPRNLALVDSHAALATGARGARGGDRGRDRARAVVIVLTRRARAATPAARRQLVPVLVGGTVALLFFSVGLVLAPLSSRRRPSSASASACSPRSRCRSPSSASLVQGRLSRAAVGELLVELREPPSRPPDLEDALRRALGDPSLELGRLRPEDGAYVDGAGAPLSLPRPASAQVATPILHQGEPVGVLVHDRSLRLRPELLDAVSAAAGFALANERALDDRAASRERATARCSTRSPTSMFRVARDGTYLDVRADDPSGAARCPPDELIGRNVRDVLPPDARATRSSPASSARSRRGAMSSIEYELEIDGVARWYESRMVPSGDGEVVTIVRDFTEQRRAEAEQRRLGDGAGGAAARGDARRRRRAARAGLPDGDGGGLPSCSASARRVLHRFEDARTSTIVGKFGEPTGRVRARQASSSSRTGAALRVLQTGAPARVDYDELDGRASRPSCARSASAAASACRSASPARPGARSSSRCARARRCRSRPSAGCRRSPSSSALAVASAHARDELAASRLRIVEASDAERRRHRAQPPRRRAAAARRALGRPAARPGEAARARPDEAEELLEPRSRGARARR